MVLGATLVFCLAFLAGPRHGLLPRWWKRYRRNRSIQIENTLKSIYQVAESVGFSRDGVRVGELSGRRNESLVEAEQAVGRLVRDGLATIVRGDGLAQDAEVLLTPAGWERARRIVRNHRLWELYLANQAHYEVDHVHDDAEVIEHVLGEETVRRLERRLDYPTRDPHGSEIPSRVTGVDKEPGKSVAQGTFRP
jgi:manganese/zinc/iron transport system permease protein